MKKFKLQFTSEWVRSKVIRHFTALKLIFTYDPNDISNSVLVSGPDLTDDLLIDIVRKTPDPAAVEWHFIIKEVKV